MTSVKTERLGNDCINVSRCYLSGVDRTIPSNADDCTRRGKPPSDFDCRRVKSGAFGRPWELCHVSIEVLFTCPGGRFVCRCFRHVSRGPKPDHSSYEYKSGDERRSGWHITDAKLDSIGSEPGALDRSPSASNLAGESSEEECRGESRQGQRHRYEDCEVDRLGQEHH